MSLAPKFLLLNLVLALPAPAAGPWVRIRSPHFELLTNARASQGREALRRFEQIRHIFETRTQQAGLSPLPVRIFLLASEAGFRPFRVQEHAAGYYTPAEDRDIIAMYVAGDSTYRVAFHEYAHLVMNHAAANAPVWFNEGFAELYSTLAATGSGVHVGGPIPPHLETLRSQPMLDLATLAAVDRRSPHYNERGKTGIFYAQSWALLHMLNFAPAYRPAMPQFIARILAGAPQLETLEQTFGKAPAAVLDDLRAYVRHGRFDGATIPAGRIPGAQASSVEPLTEVQAALLLSELLLAIGKEEDAGRLLRETTAPHRDSPELEAALAAMAARRDDTSAALRRYARAVELGSRDARVHYDYAMLLRESGTPSQTVIALLERAARLDATFFAAHYLLGYLHLREQRYADAVASLSAACALEPGRASAWEYLALAHHYAGEREQARSAARNALRVASGDAEKARMQATLDLVEKLPEILVHARPPVPAPPLYSRVEGRLAQVDCLGTMARFHVLTGSGKLFLLVRDAASVSMKNAGSASAEFSCGAQAARDVVLEYKPARHPTYGTAGEISSVEFR